MLPGLRGLCVQCYADPKVRDATPAKVKKVKRRSLKRVVRPLPVPTDVPPGPLKAEVIAARVAAGQQLWHPLDAKG